MKRIVAIVLFVLFFYAILFEGIWRWTICRVYVNEGESLLVRYKGNLLWPSPPMAQDDFAKVDEYGRPMEVGVLREMLGPGRHFRYDPIHYERTIVKDVVVVPGQVGIVTSKLGESLSGGVFLVEGDVGSTNHRGTLRKVLRPGRYRINSYGYQVELVNADGSRLSPSNSPAQDVSTAMRKSAPPTPTPNTPAGLNKRSGWVEIPTGYVGVVTNLTGDPALNTEPGIQAGVLQPGIYALNPVEQVVDIVEVGFREISIKTDLAKDRDGKVQLDENGEPAMVKTGNQGINFPSSDGFPISLDFTAIWGITPEQAPKVISLFGNVDVVEKTLIIPEIESICRIHGSKLGAVDLLIGKSREDFQTATSNDFRDVLAKKNISLQVGLVRHIYIPVDIRGPIQKANIADELKLTREMEIETAKIEASLEEARASVMKEQLTVEAETERLYQETLAEGTKTIEEIRAETEKLVAVTARKTAELEAKAVSQLGEAKAKVEGMKKEAEAQKFSLLVQAFGTPEAYNQWTFANALPTDIRLNLFYAGPGTFWTDLKGFQEAAMGKMIAETVPKPTPAASSTPTAVPASSTPWPSSVTAPTNRTVPPAPTPSPATTTPRRPVGR